MRLTRRSIITTAAATALALGLAACGGSGGNGNGSDEPAGDAGGDKKDLTIAIHNGWDEGIAVSYLWKAILEDEGYTVDVEYADPGPVYTGIAGGQFDINFDMWLPDTHADYLEQFGDDMELLGHWSDEAVLTIAVNEDAPITSLTELAEHADEFGNRLVGIEAGAGLTRITKDEVIPTYGLEGMDFIESSTPAMLAELKGAIDDGRNIVVTLWRPHRAYAEFPIRDLEDPEGALGAGERIEMAGRAGFSEDYPQLTEWLSKFSMTSDELIRLEEIMFIEKNGDENEAEAEEAVREWMEEFPDFVPNIIG